MWLCNQKRQAAAAAYRYEGKEEEPEEEEESNEGLEAELEQRNEEGDSIEKQFASIVGGNDPVDEDELMSKLNRLVRHLIVYSPSFKIGNCSQIHALTPARPCLPILSQFSDVARDRNYGEGHNLVKRTNADVCCHATTKHEK